MYQNILKIHEFAEDSVRVYGKLGKKLKMLRNGMWWRKNMIENIFVNLNFTIIIAIFFIINIKGKWVKKWILVKC